MNMLMLVVVALVALCYFGGKFCPSVLRQNKEMLLGVAVGLALCSFFDMRLEGFVSPADCASQCSMASDYCADHFCRMETTDQAGMCTQPPNPAADPCPRGDLQRLQGNADTAVAFQQGNVEALLANLANQSIQGGRTMAGGTASGNAFCSLNKLGLTTDDERSLYDLLCPSQTP
jgi:hypothetical protein